MPETIGLNTLYFGDCLDWMSRWDDKTVDLIYLDPPFNSKAGYNVLYAQEGAGDAQYRAFDDTWTWDEAAVDRLTAFESAVARPLHAAIVGLNGILGPSGMLAYLTYMAERLEHIVRLLKPTGSVYLHCDPTAAHYLKVLMDAALGAGNFRNEVIWRRTGAHGRAKRWGPIHDNLLFYTKSSKYTWNRIFEPYDEDYIEESYDSEDDHGRYQSVSLTGPGTRTGSSGKPWKGFDPTTTGRHWELPPDRSLPDWFEHPTGYSSMSIQQRLDILEEGGIIEWPKKGKVPRFKRYLAVAMAMGNPIQDIIRDIRPLSSKSKERLGYPTQKPLALLKRVVEASSNEGDLVLDPFCGCGTAVAAARDLNRSWIGIDISSFAIDLVIERRFMDKSIPTKGIPFDLASARKLAAEQPFNFESWAVTRVPGFAPNTKQVSDGGIDGKATLAEQPDNVDSRKALAQVKGGKFSLSALRDFIHVMERDDAALGCYITLDPVTSANARAEAAQYGSLVLGNHTYRRVQLWSIADYFDGKPPNMPTMTDPYTGKALHQPDMFLG